MCRDNHTNIIVKKYNTSIIYDNIITNRLKEQLHFIIFFDIKTVKVTSVAYIT